AVARNVSLRPTQGGADRRGVRHLGTRRGRPAAACTRASASRPGRHPEDPARHSMSDFMNHEPTPEFRASLEREIARALRSETQFGLAERTRRLGMIVGMTGASVAMLTLGLMLGVRTGYASAEDFGARRDSGAKSTFDILRAMPVRGALAV